MTSSIWKKIVFILILSGFSQSLAASSTSKLIIKPSVCMVKKLGDICQMTVRVMWHNDKAIDACLFQNDSRLTCWQNVQHINTEIDITLDQNMIFTLKNDQQVFAYQQIKINSAVPKKYRRRLRADWSFF